MKIILKLFILNFALLSVSLFSPKVWSVVTESIGTLSINEVLLQPHFVLQEQRQGGFKWGESQFGVLWELDSTLWAQIKVGSLELLNRQQFYNARAPQENWGMIEGYGAWVSPYGTFRMGLLPLEFGEEGAMEESELYFPRSYLYQQDVMSLRDLGFSYFILHRGFFTSLTVHNGEAGEPEDNRTWYTAKWGWQDREKFRIGASGQTGSTEPQVTSASNSQLGNFDESLPAKWRIGSVFIRWYPSDFKMLLEAFLGEVEQQGKLREKFAGGHVDLMWDWSSRWGVQFRYDHFDPNTKLDGDLQRSLSLGFSLRNATQTSRIFLIGSKVLEEGQKTPNDEIRLVWRLTPFTPIKSR